MMVSTKGRYALIVMIDLAKNQGDSYVSLADIAERQNLSMKYLENVVSILNKGNMLQSLRGKKGGYRLARPVADYKMSELLSLTEGSLAPVECIKNNDISCEKAASCMTLPLWVGLDRAIEEYLSKVTLEDVINGDRKKMLGNWCVECNSY
ncbi:MAG: Rrf2 family transcriptional regulator [Clostridiales bacterium]|nr:Rrf2 family transcriptional regulator [Candidatus Crickella merdequi]